MKNINLFIESVIILFCVLITASCGNEKSQERSKDEYSLTIDNQNGTSPDMEMQQKFLEEFQIKFGEKNIHFEKDSLGYIVELDFNFGDSNNEVEEQLIDKINEFENLRKLHINHLELAGTDEISFDFPFLEYLYLSISGDSSRVIIKNGQTLKNLQVFGGVVEVNSANILKELYVSGSNIIFNNSNLSELVSMGMVNANLKSDKGFSFKTLEKLDIGTLDKEELSVFKDIMQLKYLYIDNVNEMNTIPDFIFQNKNLEYLEVRRSELDSISPDISNLKQLENCDLMLNGHVKNLVEIAKLPNISIFCADDIPENRKQIEEAIEQGYNKYFSPGECMQ
ncbi:hypothetical protein GCM10011506_25460 [Marivirga lumbricoides]|uniref:Leucine-rich repeat domain-containing protein n=1 Tax=Marivirga lumbricoides TaxID=1046115 RepID=A0ABQ1MH60_9BACT|nr:hypothetical protein GCM10011506_25460 [Marivirga lumbricoides]